MSDPISMDIVTSTVGRRHVLTLPGINFVYIPLTAEEVEALALPESEGLCVRLSVAAGKDSKRCLCGCMDVPDNGPCNLPVKGGNGRCVYCDHALTCHTSKKWKKERK